MPGSSTPASHPPFWSAIKTDARDASRNWRKPMRQALADLEAFYLDESRRQNLREMHTAKRWVVRSWWLQDLDHAAANPERSRALLALLDELRRKKPADRPAPADLAARAVPLIPDRARRERRRTCGKHPGNAQSAHPGLQKAPASRPVGEGDRQ